MSNTESNSDREQQPNSDVTADLDEEATMPLVEHLRELQLRLRNSVLALLGGFAIAYGFKEDLFVLLLRPFYNVWMDLGSANEAVGNTPAMYFSNLIEPFWTYFTLSLWAGLFVASPLVFHQLWKFIAPGLYKTEQRYGVAFAITSAVFFTTGALFCYHLVLEQVYTFLLSYATDNLSALTATAFGDQATTAMALKPLPMMKDYLALARRLLIGFGLIFELPLLIFFLSIVGAVTHRELWRFNRWWIVVSFVISAMLTPPEIFSQVLMAGPLVVLYNLSIVISYFVTIRRERREQALSNYDDDDDEPTP